MLDLNLKTTTHQTLINELTDAKIKLKYIKRLKIDSLIDWDFSLVKFFENCTPEKIDYLCLNYLLTNAKGIKMNYSYFLIIYYIIIKVRNIIL